MSHFQDQDDYEMQIDPVDPKQNQDKMFYVKDMMVGHHFVINLDGVIDEPAAYREVFRLLDMATEYDVFEFNINTEGGYLSTTKQFINLIQRTPARCISNIYNAISAGSLIGLSCDEINVMKYASLMIHDAQAGSGFSDVNKGRDYLEATSRETATIYRDIYTGFLSPIEIEEVLHGKDKWIGEEELIQRLQNLAKFRQDLYDAHSKEDHKEEAKSKSITKSKAPAKKTPSKKRAK